MSTIEWALVGLAWLATGYWGGVLLARDWYREFGTDDLSSSWLIGALIVGPIGLAIGAVVWIVERDWTPKKRWWHRAYYWWLP